MCGRRPEMAFSFYGEPAQAAVPERSAVPA
jgi:hypothetical protein